MGEKSGHMLCTLKSTIRRVDRHYMEACSFKSSPSVRIAASKKYDLDSSMGCIVTLTSLLVLLNRLNCYDEVLFETEIENIREELNERPVVAHPQRSYLRFSFPYYSIAEKIAGFA